MPQRSRSVPPAVAPDRRTFHRFFRDGHSSPPGALWTSTNVPYAYLVCHTATVLQPIDWASLYLSPFCTVPLLHLRRSRLSATDALRVSPDRMFSVYKIQYRYPAPPHDRIVNQALISCQHEAPTAYFPI